LKNVVGSPWRNSCAEDGRRFHWRGLVRFGYIRVGSGYRRRRHCCHRRRYRHRCCRRHYRHRRCYRRHRADV